MPRICSIERYAPIEDLLPMAAGVLATVRNACFLIFRRWGRRVEHEIESPIPDD
jgi:hypothetical protein